MRSCSICVSMPGLFQRIKFLQVLLGCHRQQDFILLYWMAFLCVCACTHVCMDLRVTFSVSLAVDNHLGWLHVLLIKQNSNKIGIPVSFLHDDVFPLDIHLLVGLLDHISVLFFIRHMCLCGDMYLWTYGLLRPRGAECPGVEVIHCCEPPDMGDENGMLILCRISTCSQPWKHLSRPLF